MDQAIEPPATVSEWRTRRGVTQERLALALGVGRSSIVRWEAREYFGRPAPRLVRLALLGLESVVGAASPRENG